jgi:hypothetical protein
MKDYERVLDHTKGETAYPLEEEIEVLIRDPDTMESLRARAVIRRSFEDAPEADRLFYLSPTSGREKQPVPIEILELLADETEEVQALPTQKLSLGQRRGTMLADMIRDRGDKKTP